MLSRNSHNKLRFAILIQVSKLYASYAVNGIVTFYRTLLTAMTSSREAGSWRKDQQLHLDALVVGGGFGGLYSLFKLRDQGLHAKIFEAGTGLGGVWHWNREPLFASS